MPQAPAADFLRAHWRERADARRDRWPQDADYRVFRVNAEALVTDLGAIGARVRELLYLVVRHVTDRRRSFSMGFKTSRDRQRI
jgi:hypothetical protein